MSFKTIAIFLSLSVIVYGCSNKQLYSAVQKNRQFECQKLPESEQKKCIQEYDQPYEAFKAAREDLINEGEKQRLNSIQGEL